MHASEPFRGLLGTGHAEPADVRKNDDPIFDKVKKEFPKQDLFTGYVERRVLAPGERIEDRLVEASRAALSVARVDPSEVDVMLGYVSVSEWLDPNALAQVHRTLGLPERCWVLPLNADFSNHAAGLWLADGLLATGRAKRVLVATAGNWTRHVDYTTLQSIAAGDGAGAAVMGHTHDRAAWRVVDQEVVFRTSGLGQMGMYGDDIPGPRPPDAPFRGQRTAPYYHITAAGYDEYKVFGPQVPPQVVGRLLQRHGLQGADVTLVPYQASKMLLDTWEETIRPAAMLHTLERFGNMVVANLAVNLAVALQEDRVSTDWLVLIGLGPEPHASALLMRRG